MTEKKFVVVLECPVPDEETEAYVQDIVLRVQRSGIPKNITLYMAVAEVASNILSCLTESEE